MRFFSYYALAALLALSSTAVAQADEAAVRDAALPFAPGERLTYQLKWECVPVGEAVLEVLAPVDVDGVPCLAFRGLMWTNPAIDVFYKVRDRIDSFADLAMTRSTLFQMRQRDGGYTRDVSVLFDWQRYEASRYVGDRRKKTVSLYPGAVDMLGALFLLRTKELAVGGRVVAPVTDGNVCVRGFLSVVAREEVQAPAGRFEAFRVELDTTHFGGVFKRSAKAWARVWVSADSRRLPLKAESTVVVGKFSAELATVREGDPALLRRPAEPGPPPLQTLEWPETAP